MNLFKTTLAEGVLKLRSSRFSTCTSTNGVAIVGIRPESVRVATGGTERILWTENLGSQILCAVQCGEITLTALATRAPAAETAAIDIAPEDIYLFDAETGKNLDGSSSRHTNRA